MTMAMSRQNQFVAVFYRYSLFKKKKIIHKLFVYLLDDRYTSLMH